jgi:tetratricopeptide (TPR) repeat protein
MPFLHRATRRLPSQRQAGHARRLGASTCALMLGALALTASQTAASAPVAPSPAASAPAKPNAAAPRKPPVINSDMDAQLFYQLLVAETSANAGDAGTAYQIYLEAARKHQSGQLYQRAVEIALRARAGEQALTAAKAWRQALPQSREASEFTAQILIALGRGGTELASPLRTLIQLTPAPQQPSVVMGLPRSLARLQDRKVAAEVVDEATQPWRQPPIEMAEAWFASAEAWTQARDSDKAMAALERGRALKPEHPAVGLLAVDLMTLNPKAEAIAQAQLERPDAPILVRLAYGRRLAASQRYAEAAEQLEKVVAAQPDQLGSWLTLAAVRLELKQYDQAEAALQHVIDQREEGKAPPSPQLTSTRIGDTTDEVDQAYLLMSQVAEQRKDFAKASKWLEKADPKHERMSVQAQHARLLLRQGKLAEARKLLRDMPEAEPRDAVAKLQAEAQLLRDAKQWEEAYKVLAAGTQRFPDDSDLLYDQALLGERLQRYDEMEQQLRRVIALAPDNANAYNALGYSLADRGVRLDEARTLIDKALQIRPGDPYITDSLGWLEFRAGHVDEALRLLREAYHARPDPEIAAHLGEVLWQNGQHDEAMKVWREALQLDDDNETLLGTLKRFKVQP